MDPELEAMIAISKSPALAPRLHVPSVLIAPAGLSVLTPFGEGACAKLRLDATASRLHGARQLPCAQP
jgi:hypothetical protein